LPSSLRVSSSLVSAIWPSSAKKDMLSTLGARLTIGGTIPIGGDAAALGGSM
jgi:hypothetical protein